MRIGDPDIERTQVRGVAVRRKRPLFRTHAGLTVVELLVCCAVLALTVVASTHAMLTANHNAASSRLMTAARAVVQRNIDEALSLSFKSTTTVPPVLAITGANGVDYDDDGGAAGVAISVEENGTTINVTGTLTRIVTAVSNTENADIRNITFRLKYFYRGRPYTVEMTTIRSIDD